MLVHWMWLHLLKNLTLRQKKALLQRCTDPEQLYQADEKTLKRIEGISVPMVEALMQKDLRPAQKILDDCTEKHIGILTYYDSGYPGKLRSIHHPPLILFYKGTLPDWGGRPAIGVVGTRKATPYGLRISRNMGYQIAGAGALVVSGGAAGIDAEALYGALQAGKPAVAVLGCGVDVVYPAANRALFEKLEQCGCILSEYIPGTRPDRWRFPERNRIISGISSGILVVEAPERSGALNTAHHAKEQGRDVFVVTGNIDNPLCTGSNALLDEGAVSVRSGWQLVESYESLYPGVLHRFEEQIAQQAEPAAPIQRPAPKAKPTKKPIDNRKKSNYSVLDRENKSYTPEEQAILACLKSTPCPVDEVIAATGLPAQRVLSLLTMLTLKGAVQNHPGKCVSIK